MTVAFPHGCSMFGGDKHYLGTEDTCWPCSHGPLKWPLCCTAQPRRDRQMEGPEGAHHRLHMTSPLRSHRWPPPDPTVGAQTEASP